MRGIVRLRFVAVVLLIPALCLGYLSLVIKCESIGKELKTLDREIEDLHRKCLNEESRWMKMKSPGEIEKALRRCRLEMTWPADRQVVRLSPAEPFDVLASTERRRQVHYAQVRRVLMND